MFEEGLYIPIVKLIDQGDRQRDLVAIIRANTRLPVDTEGDIYSLAPATMSARSVSSR